MVSFQASCTLLMTSGLSGSPAPQTSRRASLQAARSSWIKSRHTVGGAQKVVTAQRSSTPSSALALNGAWLTISTVAPAFHGAKKVLHACLQHLLRAVERGRHSADRQPGAVQRQGAAGRAGALRRHHLLCAAHGV